MLGVDPTQDRAPAVDASMSFSGSAMSPPSLIPPHGVVPPPSMVPPPALSDGSSYSERYRGTQWGAPVAPTPVMQPSTTRSGSRVALAVGGVLLVVVTLGSFLLLARPPAPTRALALASAAPVTPAPSAAATAVAGPSAGAPASSVPGTSPSASPDATPAPTARPPRDGSVAARFAARVADPQVSFHVAVRGRFAFGNETGRLLCSFDVAGPDMRGRMRISQGRVSLEAEIVVKDGNGYVRPAGEAWTRDDSAASSGMTADPFGGDSGMDTLDGLTYEGTVRLDGATWHHLRLPRIDWRLVGSALLDANQGGMRIRDLDYDIYVTNGGIPHSARISFDGTSIDSGVRVDMTFTIDYRFSRFGRPARIEAPDVPSDPSD
jgi:hypothetical protein